MIESFKGIFTTAVFLLLYVFSTSQAHQLSVHLNYSHNGIGFKNESCDGMLTFGDKDIVKFDPQRIPAQCNCEINLKKSAVISKDDIKNTYILAWFGPGHDGTGYSDRVDKYDNLLLNTSSYKYPLKLSIQPAESPPITFFDQTVDVRRLPFRIFLRGKIKMICVINETYEAPIQPLITDVETITTAGIQYDKIIDIVNTDKKERKENIPTSTSHLFTASVTRPSHNNAVIIGVIFVLIFIIILASSMILVSLILHRKRLARRLALHLHTLEEARHLENLGKSSNDIAKKNVKLLSVRKLNTKDQSVQKVQCLTPVNALVTDEEPSSTFEEDESTKLIKFNEKNEEGDKSGKNNNFDEDNPYITCTNSDFRNISEDSYDDSINTNNTAQCNGVQKTCNSNPDYQYTKTASDKTCNVSCTDKGKDNKICNTLDYIILPQTNVPPSSQENTYNLPKKDQCVQVYLTDENVKEINDIYITDPTLSHAQMKEHQLNIWQNRKRAKSCSQ